MVLTEYSQKLILKYFISTVGESQNELLEFDFGFHAFGPFRKLTRHRAATPGAKVFVLVVVFIVLIFPGSRWNSLPPGTLTCLARKARQRLKPILE